MKQNYQGLDIKLLHNQDYIIMKVPIGITNFRNYFCICTRNNEASDNAKAINLSITKGIAMRENGINGSIIFPEITDILKYTNYIFYIMINISDNID